MKKRALLIWLLLLTLVFTACTSKVSVKEEPLPAPRAEGFENDYAFDHASINSDNLDLYLNRKDTIYVDIREVSEYEEGHLEGFVNLPYWGYIIPKEGEEGDPHPLYSGSKEEPIAMYEESDEVLGEIVAQFEDKNVFFM